MVRAPVLEESEAQASFEFIYLDGARSGTKVVEKLHIGRKPGFIEWSRVPHGGDGHIGLSDLSKKWNQTSFKGQGGMWSLQMVSSVRYTTRVGDPGKEHWQKPDKRNHFIINAAITLRRLVILVLNPMSVAVAICCFLTEALWDVFPVENGRYVMAKGANENALDSITTLAFFAILTAMIAGWWLGAFRLRALRRCGIDQESFAKGVVSRLPPSIQRRYKIQRPLNVGCLCLYISWCTFLLCLGPSAKAGNTGEVCSPWSIAQPFLLANNSVNGSLLATSGRQCYMEGEDEFKCGVDGCNCESTWELGCLPPPDLPSQDCHYAVKPLCTEGDSDVDASGLHDLMVMVAILHCWIAGLLALLWCLNQVAMLSVWFLTQATDDENSYPQVIYHKFVVHFRNRPEQTLVFTLDVDKDPHRVAKMLLLGRGRQRLQRRAPVAKSPCSPVAWPENTSPITPLVVESVPVAASRVVTRKSNTEASGKSRALVRKTSELSCDSELEPDWC